MVGIPKACNPLANMERSRPYLFQTQKVAVNTTNFDGLESGNGWMLLVFDPSVYGELIERLDFDDLFLQSYLFVKYNYNGYSTAVEGTDMANFWWNFDQVLPYLDMYDGLNDCPIKEVGAVHTDGACLAGFNLSAVH